METAILTETQEKFKYRIRALLLKKMQEKTDAGIHYTFDDAINEFTKFVGVSSRTPYRWMTVRESDTYYIDSNSLIKCCEYFQVKLEDLYSDYATFLENLQLEKA